MMLLLMGFIMMAMICYGHLYKQILLACGVVKQLT